MEEMKDSQETVRGLMTAGGVAGLLALVLGIFDIVIGSVTGANLEALSSDALGRFADFAASPLLGLYRLDALNLVSSVVTLVFAAALYVSLKDISGPLSLLALLFLGIGTSAMISGNAAFAMMSLAGKFSVAQGESSKAVFIAAGEALLARGAHGSPAMFFAFSLPSLGNTLFALGMLRSGRYGKKTAWAGILGSGLLLVYVVLVTFVPGAGRFALYLAAPGGIAALLWILGSSLSLFRHGREA